jgi:flagellar hook assembly protein FlgD
MSRTTLIITILLLGATSAGAETFNQKPYLPEAGVNVLTRNVANQQFGRNLFGDPYATVVIGNVDVYDRFPYIEARYFQVVSDPQWNRLLMGEVGQGLFAHDGAGDAFGQLSAPRGLSSDASGRVYVADTGNDRVLVFKAVTEYERIALEPVFAIEGLSKPYGVAYSDGGTPFNASDDVLYVANTGHNEIRRYALTGTDARLTDAIGELGSGDGFFAGPMAIAAGRRDGVNCNEVFVADAHNGRIVRLRDTGGSLAWSGAVKHGLGTVTSLDTDHWGNVYAAAPQAGRVAKFTAALLPVASLSGGIEHPRSFHTVFANVTDHRNGTTRRSGQGSGVLVEEWGGHSGLRMVGLGVELKDAAASGANGASVSMTLTDHAAVTAEIIDARNGQVVARHDAGLMTAGPQTLRFDSGDYIASWSTGEYRISVHAKSTYDGGVVGSVEVPVSLSGTGGPALASRLTLFGNMPNPFNPSTTIRFSVPAGGPRPYSLRVYDVRGALVRELASGQISGGMHEVRWDGRDERGAGVSSGVYLYRVTAGSESLTGKMALLK